MNVFPKLSSNWWISKKFKQIVLKIYSYDISATNVHKVVTLWTKRIRENIRMKHSNKRIRFFTSLQDLWNYFIISLDLLQFFPFFFNIFPIKTNSSFIYQILDGSHIPRKISPCPKKLKYVKLTTIFKIISRKVSPLPFNYVSGIEINLGSLTGQPFGSG